MADDQCQDDLRAILRRFVAEFGARWPGCEHGKAFYGNWVLDAMRQHGMDAGAELRAAMKEIDATQA